MKTRTKLMLLFIITFMWRCNSNDNQSVVNSSSVIHNRDTTSLRIIGAWQGEGLKEGIFQDWCRYFEFKHQEYPIYMRYPETVYYNRKDLTSEYRFVADQVKKSFSDWDVIRVNGQFVQVGDYMKDPNWAAKYLVDFSQFPDFMNNVQPELVDSIKKSCGGIIPGPINEGYNWSIWYNQELADTLGLKIKNSGMTPDDLIHYVEVLHEYNTIHNMSIFPIFISADWPSFYNLALQMYVSEVNDKIEVLSNRITERKIDAWHKTLMVFEKLAKLKSFDYNFSHYTFLNSADFPLKKKCLFYVNATWMYNIWEKIDKIELRKMQPAEMPCFQNTDIYFGGYTITWVVPLNSPHKDAAILFLKSINTADVADQWNRNTKSKSGIIGVMSNGSFGKDQFEQFNQMIDEKYKMNRLQSENDCLLILGKKHQNNSNYLLDVAYGHLTADEAIQKMRRDVLN